MTRRPIDEQLMTDFLLGNLPEEEIEQLDEMSLADDHFANRLQAAENDLVDAYVRGELSGLSLTQFKSNYLRSSKRREKVQFAETLQRQLNNSANIDRSSSIATRSGPQWLLAAAAILVLSLCAYLFFQNVNLHNQIQQMQAEKESLRNQEQELQKQIALLKNQQSKIKPNDVKLMAFVLMPQTRGLNKIPLLNIPVKTDSIALTLKFEINEYPVYRAALKDPATDNLIWKSENVKADENNSVQVRIPVSLLRSQNYLMDLSGISANGAAEIVSSYPFRISTQ